MWSGLELGRKATKKRVIQAWEYFRALSPAQERMQTGSKSDLIPAVCPYRGPLSAPGMGCAQPHPI